MNKLHSRVGHVVFSVVPDHFQLLRSLFFYDGHCLYQSVRGISYVMKKDCSYE